MLFPDQSVGSLVEAVSWFEQNRIWRRLDAGVIRQWAERFEHEAFQARLTCSCDKPGRPIRAAVPLQRVTPLRCLSLSCDVELARRS